MTTPVTTVVTGPSTIRYPNNHPTRFAYAIEGEVTVGTVANYVKALEEADYYGLDVSGRVWTFEAGEPVEHFPTVTATPFDEDQWATMTVELDLGGEFPEVASIRIDGRV